MEYIIKERKKKKKKVKGNKEYYIHNDIKTNDKQKVLIDKKNINKNSINNMDSMIKPFNMKKKYNLDSSFIEAIDKSIYKNNQKNNLESQITSDEENDAKFPLFYVEENKNRIKNKQNENMNKNKMDMKKGRDVYNVQEEYDEDMIAGGGCSKCERK